MNKRKVKRLITTLRNVANELEDALDDPELQPGPEHVREEVAPSGSSRQRDC